MVSKMPRRRWTTINWPKVRWQWRSWIIGGGAPGFGGWFVAVGPFRLLFMFRPKPRPDFYDLEAQSKFLAPILTPLRNEIPRVSGKGGIRASWRAALGMAPEEGKPVTTEDYVAAYKATGIEDDSRYVEAGKDDLSHYVKPATMDELKDALSKALSPGEAKKTEKEE